MTQKNDIDSQILRLLAEDSRQSYRELAKQLNISHVSVSSRVKALEESGVIRGYTCVIDHDKLDYYPLCLRISASQGGNLSRIGDEVASHPEVNVEILDGDMLSFEEIIRRLDADVVGISPKLFSLNNLYLCLLL